MTPALIFEFIYKKIKIFVVFLFLSYSISLYFACVASNDYLQGAFVKIMYVHVPSAYLSTICYSCVVLLNVVGILFKKPKIYLYSYSLAFVGLMYTAICLITGSIWAKTMWGTFWEWDARLTSVLVLFFIYLSYILLWDYSDKQSFLAAIFSIVGFVNIPIIKFSVNFWATVHQKSSIVRKTGIAIDFEILYPLIMMFFSSCFFTLVLWIVIYKYVQNYKLSLQSLYN